MSVGLIVLIVVVALVVIYFVVTFNNLVRLRIRADERGDGVERVEEEVGVHLRAQRPELGLAGRHLRLQRRPLGVA